MKTKNKALPLSQNSELAFTVDIQLEDAIRRLGTVAGGSIRLELVGDEHDGLVDFSAQHWRNGTPNAEAKGTLRRWLGTSTKVECSGHGKTSVFYSDFMVQLVFVFGLMTLCAMGIGLYIAAGFLIVYDWAAAIQCFLIPISLAGLVATWFARTYIQNVFAKRDYQTMRDLEDLMQKLSRNLNDGSAVIEENGHLYDAKNPLQRGYAHLKD